MPPELLPLLRDKIPELEKDFPHIAKSVKELINPAPAFPAAALHGAQAACQIAFRELQSAESHVSEYESEANELVADLRAKVVQLNDAQSALSIARAKYEDAAKAAQSEVTKYTKEPGQDHVNALISSLTPDKLDEIAKSLAAAALQARLQVNIDAGAAVAASQQATAAAQQAAADAASPTVAAALQPNTNAAHGTPAVAPTFAFGVAPEVAVANAAPGAQGDAQAPPPLENSPPASVSGEPVHQQQPMQDVEEVPTPQPAVLGNSADGKSSERRSASRSPRRQKSDASSPRGSADLDVFDDAESSAKVQKTNQSQQATTRSKSIGSNGSHRSCVSAAESGINSVAHFTEIGNQLEGQVKIAGLPTP